jgi:hypothetical protein
MTTRRSLRAYHHYVPIFKHSEHDLMPRLTWARHHEPQVQHIIHQANLFALQYVTYPARLLYWKYVLLAYRSLVPDMAQYFQQSGSTGSQMEVLLKSLAGVGSKRGGGAVLPPPTPSSSSSSRGSLRGVSRPVTRQGGAAFSVAASAGVATPQQAAAVESLAGDEVLWDDSASSGALSALAGDD